MIRDKIREIRGCVNTSGSFTHGKTDIFGSERQRGLGCSGVFTPATSKGRGRVPGRDSDRTTSDLSVHLPLLSTFCPPSTPTGPMDDPQGKAHTVEPPVHFVLEEQRLQRHVSKPGADGHPVQVRRSLGRGPGGSGAESEVGTGPEVPRSCPRGRDGSSCSV